MGVKPVVPTTPRVISASSKLEYSKVANAVLPLFKGLNRSGEGFGVSLAVIDTVSSASSVAGRAVGIAHAVCLDNGKEGYVSSAAAQSMIVPSSFLGLPFYTTLLIQDGPQKLAILKGEVMGYGIKGQFHSGFILAYWSSCLFFSITGAVSYMVGIVNECVSGFGTDNIAQHQSVNASIAKVSGAISIVSNSLQFLRACFGVNRLLYFRSKLGNLKNLSASLENLKKGITATSQEVLDKLGAKEINERLEKEAKKRLGKVIRQFLTALPKDDPAYAQVQNRLGSAFLSGVFGKSHEQIFDESASSITELEAHFQDPANESDYNDFLKAIGVEFSPSDLKAKGISVRGAFGLSLLRSQLEETKQTKMALYIGKSNLKEVKQLLTAQKVDRIAQVKIGHILATKETEALIQKISERLASNEKWAYIFAVIALCALVSTILTCPYIAAVPLSVIVIGLVLGSISSGYYVWVGSRDIYKSLSKQGVNRSDVKLITACMYACLTASLSVFTLALAFNPFGLATIGSAIALFVILNTLMAGVAIIFNTQMGRRGALEVGASIIYLWEKTKGMLSKSGKTPLLIDHKDIDKSRKEEKHKQVLAQFQTLTPKKQKSWLSKVNASLYIPDFEELKNFKDEELIDNYADSVALKMLISNALKKHIEEKGLWKNEYKLLKLPPKDQLLMLNEASRLEIRQAFFNERIQSLWNDNILNDEDKDKIATHLKDHKLKKDNKSAIHFLTLVKHGPT